MSIEDIVKQYNKLVYKICLDMTNSPFDAEELAQETFINFYKNIKRYNNLTPNEIKNLICKIALNRCKDYLKSKVAKQNSLTDADYEALENYKVENDIDEKIFKMQRKQLVQKAINELEEPYKTIIYKYFIEEITLDELEIKLKIPKATIKMQIYRGKKKLKEILDKNGGATYYEK